MSRIIYLLGFCYLIMIQGKTLRGSANDLVESIIIFHSKQMFNRVYWSVIDQVAKNQPIRPFTLYCTLKNSSKNLPYTNCTDGYEQWKTKNYWHEMAVYNVETIQVQVDIMAQIAQTFSDANITTYNKNCCNYYNITWSKN